MKLRPSLAVPVMLLCVLLLSATTLAAPSATPAPAGGGPALAWLDSWSSALGEAQKSRKPILLEFVTDWCPHCDHLSRTTFKDPKVLAFQKDFVWVRTNADHDPILPKKFGTTAYPVMLIADPWGAEWFRMMGYKSPEEFSAVLKVFRDATTPLVGYGEALQKDKGDPRALGGLGDFYRENGLPEKAIENYRNGMKKAAGADKTRLLAGCARACADKKDWKSAEKEARALLDDPSASPAHASANVTLALVYRGHGMEKEARDLLSKVASGPAGDPAAKEAKDLLAPPGK